MARATTPRVLAHGVLYRGATAEALRLHVGEEAPAAGRAGTGTSCQVQVQLYLKVDFILYLKVLEGTAAST